MKILFLSHNFSPFIGGIEVISEMLCRGFSAAGHEVKVLTWTQEKNEENFPFQVVRNPGVGTLLKLHIWADFVFENNPSLRLSWPRLFLNRPSVVALHTWITRTSGKIALQDRLKMSWLKKASGVIAVSDALRRSAWPASTVIGNPYRAGDFRVLPEIRREKEFVFLGRLVEDKGIDLAIKAVHRVTNAIKNTSPANSLPKLTIIGEGPELLKLKFLVKELDMEAQVTFAGPMRGEALVHTLNEHQFQLIPSTWEEPFGIVALEGIACGCLPIASDGGGLPDAVGKAGVLFKRGDLDALESAILGVMNNAALQRQYLDNRVEHLRSFHPDTVIDQYLRVIESVTPESRFA